MWGGLGHLGIKRRSPDPAPGLRGVVPARSVCHPIGASRRAGVSDAQPARAPRYFLAAYEAPPLVGGGACRRVRPRHTGFVVAVVLGQSRMFTPQRLCCDGCQPCGLPGRHSLVRPGCRRRHRRQRAPARRPGRATPESEGANGRGRTAGGCRGYCPPPGRCGEG